MPNPGQPTIQEGAHGEAVKRLQRALRRAPGPHLVVDGIFGPATKQAVQEFQQADGLVVDGIVGPATWGALPDGGPMPLLEVGSNGEIVRDLQEVLTNGAPGQWDTGPGGIDGEFGPHTLQSVEAFQKWGDVGIDGIVGDNTWAVSLHAMNATLETQVGLDHVIG
jgi:peptidoglycan hydrolase-like protein with peptidoglycan-binding domain